MTVHLVLMLIACILFLLAALNVQSGPVNLSGWGLFFFSLSFLVSGYIVGGRGL